MKKFHSRALMLCEVEEAITIFLGNLQGNRIPWGGYWISLLRESSNVLTGPVLLREGEGCWWPWGDPHSPGLHDAKCYHVEKGRGPSVLVVAAVSVSSESEAVSFLSHSLPLPFPFWFWILVWQIRGRKAKDGLPHLGQKIRFWTSFLELAGCWHLEKAGQG